MVVIQCHYDGGQRLLTGGHLHALLKRKWAANAGDQCQGKQQPGEQVHLHPGGMHGNETESICLCNYGRWVWAKSSEVDKGGSCLQVWLMLVV